MPRPKKNRQVLCSPAILYFKPRAIPMATLEETVLAADELEALRLADLEGCYHEAAAARMGISRQTFGNIVKGARKKIADALVHGRAIRLESRPGAALFFCDHCSHSWESAAGNAVPEACPHCKSARNSRARDAATQQMP